MGKKTNVDTEVANSETTQAPTETTPTETTPTETTPTETTPTEIADLLDGGTDIVLTQDEIDAAKAASADVDEAIRISKMTQEEINAEFGPTEAEGVAFLRAMIMKAGGPHMDRKLSLLQKIEDAISY